MCSKVRRLQGSLVRLTGLLPGFIILLLSASLTQAAPPYAGTVFVDPDIIKSSDPSSFQGVTALGSGTRQMYDRRAGWLTLNALLFTAGYSDGNPIEVQVNPEFSAEEAAEKAAYYAYAIGQLPAALRTSVQTVWIHKGNEAFGGGNNNILIHTDSPGYHGEWLEETLFHEAGHTSIDARLYNTAVWNNARSADPEYISSYAQDNPDSEDVAESVLLYYAVRYRPERLSTQAVAVIEAAMPARLQAFDTLGIEAVVNNASLTSVIGVRNVSVNRRDTRAYFAFGMTAADRPAFSASANLRDNNVIKGEINPDPAYVGQTGDIFMVLLHNNLMWMKDQSNTWVRWVGSNIATLVPLRDDVELSLGMQETFFSGQLDSFGGLNKGLPVQFSGQVALFLGYAGADGILHHNLSPYVLSISTETRLEQARTLFDAAISPDIVQARCIICHVSGGAAAGLAQHVFTRTSSPAHLADNFAVIQSLLQARGKSYILSKVTGGSGHGGGVQLTANSEEYSALASFLDLLGGTLPLSRWLANGNASDSVAPANNGTVVNGASYVAGRNGGQAFSFNGSNHISVVREISTDFTISGWIRTSATAPDGGQFYSGNGVIHADVAGNLNDFGISILGNQLAFGTGNPDTTIRTVSAVTTGEWLHFAAVRSGSTISLWLNGQLEARIITSNASALDAPATIALGGNAADLRYFSGQLDDLAFYTFALTQAEIAALSQTNPE